MRAIGDVVRLRYRTDAGWDPPRVNDVLRTVRGRCYLVREVRGKLESKSRLLICTVVPDDVQTPGAWYRLVWDKRRKRVGARPPR